MTKPTKPTAPEPALRSQPDTFSTRLEANILFWPELTTYMDETSDYVDGVNTQVQAAAVAGNLSSLDMSAIAGLVIGVNDAGTDVEGVEVVEAIKATEAQAEAGTDDEAYMTPLTTKAAVLEHAKVLGAGQEFQTVTRSAGVSYQNTTGQTIFVTIHRTGDGRTTDVSADGSTWVPLVDGSGTSLACFPVPHGHYYRISGSVSSIYSWKELRA